MKTDSRLLIVSSLILLLVVWITILTTGYDTTIKHQQSQIDSLNYKLFELKVDNIRHEITREKILKPNKEINKQYEQYYNYETK